MEAYKVSSLDVIGYSREEKYYVDYKKTEGDFYNRLGTVIHENEDLVEANDYEGKSPWKIERFPRKEQVVKWVYYLTWETYCTQDGQESGIVGNEIVIEKIEVDPVSN
ncbi:hypothetical protein [Bacillus cereus]|uniref:hypothetical protein n=1 Tax=Bacillus cereus TaxID=1396 RepID=UPI0018CCD6AA|nr:hypothetical protein [Bacillus cereus]